MNKVFLRLEGLLILLSCIYVYYMKDFKPAWLIVFLFLPDLSMLGYLRSNKAGAMLYNTFHTYLISGLVILAGLFFNNHYLLQVGLIWTTHIGLDRVMGFGLKNSMRFTDTHISRA